MPVELRIGDVVRLRKPHPCGSFEWGIVRIGADIGMRCEKCKHRVLLPRTEVERRLVRFTSRAPQADPFGIGEGPLEASRSSSEEGG